MPLIPLALQGGTEANFILDAVLHDQPQIRTQMSHLLLPEHPDNSAIQSNSEQFLPRHEAVLAQEG